MSKTSKSVFNPSPQQASFLTWMTDGSGSAFLEAVAGAGKTTTLIQALKRTSGSVAFAAYNKKIALEIQAKFDDLVRDGEVPPTVGKVKIGTFHSFGFNAWRKVHPRVEVDKDGRKKGNQIITALGIKPDLQGFVMQLVSLAKNRAINEVQEKNDENWWNIIEHHDLTTMLGDVNLAEEGVDLAKASLRMSRNLSSQIINFDDMIYMPSISNIDFWQNDWVFVDEAQDTNPARRILASKMLKRRGRSVWVGDRHQAIYGFTGADNDAVDLIIKDFKCKQMPLTITYRCPKNVVNVAKQYVNHIEAAETAPEGIVRDLKQEQLVDEGLKFGDAVLCRKTKPLVDVAYALIRKNIPCYIEGREFGKGLIRLIDRMKAHDIDSLTSKLEAFKEREMAKYIEQKRESMAGEVEDRVDTIFALMQGMKTVEDLVAKIQGLFEDSEGKPKPAVVLSTVHKSKGREWNRVYILGYREYMPSGWARQDWEFEQETNLVYVAVTRSQNELVLVQAKTQ